MVKSKLRSRLFRDGAAAFRNVTGHLQEDIYVCPLCRVGFAESVLAVQPARLTLEHVPPRAVDNRTAAAMCLTCASCNSTGGHALDAEWAKRESILRFAFNESGTFKGQLKVAGVETRATFWCQADSIHVCVVPAANDPRALTEMQQGMRTMAGDSARRPELSIDFPAYRHREANLAMLRGAFLAAFSAQGYRYALSAGAELVQRQILNPKNEYLDSFAVLDAGLDRNLRQVCLANDSDGNWFPVVLIGVNAIVLPGINHASPEFYTSLRTGSNHDTLRLNLKPIGWPPAIRFAIDKLS